MTGRYGATTVAVFASVCLVSSTEAGQTQTGEADGWTPPRTADGQPDLQGKWTLATFTPLERPDRFGDRQFLTEEEAVELLNLLTALGTNPLARSVFGEEDPDLRRERAVQTKENIHYDNAVWLREERPKSLSSLRTSLIVDPLDGRIPELTSEAQKREAKRLITREHLVRSRPGPVFDSYETRSLAERCVVWRHEGPPLVPPSYNDILQIFQTRDYVVIFQELSNNPPRIVPLDGRPHIHGRIRQWPGDSRGHWEGETLVVETTNFTHKTHFHGASETLRVVERFTREGEERILYQWTVDDPAAFTRSWSAEIPMVGTDEMMFEYACHEGNHDIVNILTMSRNLERQTAEREAVQTGSR